MRIVRDKNIRYVFACVYFNGAKMFFREADGVNKPDWTCSIADATKFAVTQPTNVPIDFRYVIYGAVKGFAAV